MGKNTAAAARPRRLSATCMPGSGRVAAGDLTALRVACMVLGLGLGACGSVVGIGTGSDVGPEDVEFDADPGDAGSEDGDVGPDGWIHAWGPTETDGTRSLARGASIAVTSTGDIYAAGYTRHDGVFHAAVVSYDAWGALRWARVASFGWETYALQVAVDASGIYVFGAYGYDTPLLWKFDENGALLWSVSFSFSSGTYAGSFGVLPDGGVLIAADIATSPASASSMLVRINADGSQAYAKRLVDEGYYSIVAVASDGTGYFVASTDGLSIARIEPSSGDMLWHRRFIYPQYLHPEGAVATDEGLVVFMTAHDTCRDPYSLVFTRWNEDGTLAAQGGAQHTWSTIDCAMPDVSIAPAGADGFVGTFTAGLGEPESNVLFRVSRDMTVSAAERLEGIYLTNTLSAGDAMFFTGFGALPPAAPAWQALPGLEPMDTSGTVEDAALLEWTAVDLGLGEASVEWTEPTGDFDVIDETRTDLIVGRR